MKCKINFTNIKKCKTEDVRCILVNIYWIDARIGNMNLIKTFFLTCSILKKYEWYSIQFIRLHPDLVIWI